MLRPFLELQNQWHESLLGLYLLEVFGSPFGSLCLIHFAFGLRRVGVAGLLVGCAFCAFCAIFVSLLETPQAFLFLLLLTGEFLSTLFGSIVVACQFVTPSMKKGPRSPRAPFKDRTSSSTPVRLSGVGCSPR